MSSELKSPRCAIRRAADVLLLARSATGAVSFPGSAARLPVDIKVQQAWRKVLPGEPAFAHLVPEPVLTSRLIDPQVNPMLPFCQGADPIGTRSVFAAVVHSAEHAVHGIVDWAKRIAGHHVTFQPHLVPEDHIPTVLEIRVDGPVSAESVNEGSQRRLECGARTTNDARIQDGRLGVAEKGEVSCTVAAVQPGSDGLSPEPLANAPRAAIGSNEESWR